MLLAALSLSSAVYAPAAAAAGSAGPDARAATIEAALDTARHFTAALPAVVPPAHPRSRRYERQRRATIAAAVRLARRRLGSSRKLRMAWPAVLPPRLKRLDLGLRSTAIEFALQTARQEITAADGRESRVSNTQVQERLSLRQSGAYIYHPKLLTFSLGGDFGLAPDWSSEVNGGRVRTGTLRAYDATGTLLPESPTSLDLFATRQHSLLAREFAGQNEWVTENRGVTLFARRLPMPSSVTLRRELQDESSQVGDAAVEREDWRDIVTYEGERGWLNSDLRLRYELVDLTAERTPTLNYQSHDSTLRYGADFGPELNRHMETQLRYFTRAGSTDLTSVTADERLRVDHVERLWSEHRYRFASHETGGRTSRQHALSISLHHQLFESLTTTLGGDAGQQSLSGGGKDTLGSRLDVDYTKRLPAEGRLNAGFGGQLAYEQDRFDVTESSAVQELHDIPTAVVGPISLENAQVDALSVVVTKTELGPVPPGCITPSGPPVPLVLGRDYTLVNVNHFVQILPFACSGAAPGINPGDTLAVDYRFAVTPSMAFSTRAWQGSLEADYRWIRPYLSYEQAAQQLMSGTDSGLLEDQRSRAAGVELRADTAHLRVNLLGEASQYRASRIAYDRVRTSQLLTCPVRADVTMTFSAEQSWLEYTEPAHHARHLLEYATLTYAPRPDLLVETSLSRRATNDTLVPDERNTELSLRLRWFVRQLEVEPLLKLFGWQRGGTHAREYRAFVRVLRRF